MAEDMITRAARALEQACEGDVTRLPIPNPRTWDTPMSAIGVTSKDAARAALLAALDPNDQCTVDVAAAVLRETGPIDMSVDNSERCVRAILNALRGLTAQGETK